MMRLLTLLAVLSLAACATPTAVSPVRFLNQAPVWKVNDRNDVPEKPKESEYARTLYQSDGYVIRRLTRNLDFNPHVRAKSVNSLGEVPDSTWFTNRIGIRDLSIDEIRRGPNADDGPEAHKPWTVVGGKVGGTAVGFLIKDARGIKYLLKFDNQRFPEVETANDIIAQRLLWACGYNVPEDYVVQFERNELVVADDAVLKDTFGNKTPMTIKDVDDDLARVFRDESGVYRGLVSKYLPGIPIGGYYREGVRDDDPNDIIPHEQRRELRGQYAIFAWLNHTDLQEDNTLDVYEPDPHDENKHYVVHYLIDFGKALGGMARLNFRPTVGYSHLFDIEQGVFSLFTLGLWKRPWEGQVLTELRGIGLLTAENYDPGGWKQNSPYWPLDDKDRFDAFWGAKLLVRFTPQHIRTAVEQGRFTDPRATDYMTRVLIERQRITARYWFQQVAPVDSFEASGTAERFDLCFDDLTIRHALENVGATTTYRAETFDYDGQAIGRGGATPGADGRACVRGLRGGSTSGSYTIVKLSTVRGATAMPATEIHLGHSPEHGSLRVIGIHRH